MGFHRLHTDHLGMKAKADYSRHHNSQANHQTLFFGLLGLGIVVLIVLFVYLYYRRVKRNRTDSYDGLGAGLQRFSYNELKAATNSFDDSMKLGKGGFGFVYKGVLRNGKEVAVKRLDVSSLQGDQEFQNELAIIGGLRCPFIVSLLGYCAEGNRRLLVYEHMQNGSLQQALFDEDDISLPCKLDWEKRFNIILDVAQALAFLHLECDSPIIHGDIKPSNVLLDSNYNARIADFGLARLKSDDMHLYHDMFSQDLGRSQEIVGRSQDLLKSQDLARVPGSKAELASDDESKMKSKYRYHGEGSISRKTESISIDIDEPTKEICYHDMSSQDLGRSQEMVGRSQDLLKSQEIAGILGSKAELAFDEESKVKSKPRCHGEGSNGKKMDNNGIDIDEPIKEQPESSAQGLDADEFHAKGKEIVSGHLGICGSRRLHNMLEVDDHSPKIDPSEEGTDWSKEMQVLPSDKNNKEIHLQKSRSVDCWSWIYDSSGELGTKDNVMEGIGSQIGQSRTSDKMKGKKSRKRKRLPDYNHPSGEIISRSSSMRKIEEDIKEKPRKIKEWWKEEYFAEMSKKSKKMNKLEKIRWKSSRRFDCRRNIRTNSRGRDSLYDYSGDISFGSNRDKIKRVYSMGSDVCSGDLLSRGDLSNTTSMRGTVCYIPPEYGGCGFPSEKGDIYSFGVLMLVIVSGRRPLHLLASPMKDFEKANLISWARHLAQTGNVLELVSESLKGFYDRDQALLCITVSLMCLQRIPEMRPDISEIVKIMKGEVDAPSLPQEFSPSPGRLYTKSKKKVFLDAIGTPDVP